MAVAALPITWTTAAQTMPSNGCAIASQNSTESDTTSDSDKTTSTPAGSSARSYGGWPTDDVTHVQDRRAYENRSRTRSRRAS